MKDAEYYLKLNYPVTLQALSVEDGGGYAATIPLLGRNTFMAVGETTAEALTALEELRQVLIPYLVKQGTKLPEPETEEVIAQYSGSLMLRVPRNLHAQLASEAKRNGCSINKLATQLLAQGLAGPPTVANIQSIVADAVAEGMREALSRQNAGPVPSVFAARRWDIDEEELCLRPDDWADLTLLSDLPQRERERMNLLPEFQQATDKLTPAEYQRYLQGIELTDITLEGLETSVNRLAVESSETFQLRLERKLRIDVQPDRQPALLVEYLVRGMARQKVAVKVRATYRLQIETERPLPVEFFAIYGKLSADMQVWPYFRELVSAVTSRMGVPRLTLPLRKEQTLLRESADKAGA